jgi:hypothetical protein
VSKDTEVSISFRHKELPTTIKKDAEDFSSTSNR